MNSFRLALAGVLAGAVLAGCASGGNGTGGLPTCGTTPVASGPDAPLATISLTAPAEARSGSVIYPKVTIRVTGSTVPPDLGAPAQILIARAGKVVGAYSGVVGGTGLLVQPGATAQPVPVGPVLLSGCVTEPVDVGKPDASRRPLPPGEYQLIARLEGGEYGRAASALVSPAWSIRIT